MLARPDPLERLLRLGVAFAFVGVAIQTVLHLTNNLVLDGDVESFDPDAEHNALAWASASATFAAAYVALVRAVLVPQSRTRYLLIAAIFGFFSLDDAIEIHEQVSWNLAVETLGLPSYVQGRLFAVIYLPLLAGAGFLLWRIARESPARIRVHIQAGLGLLVLAVLVEPVTLIWQSQGVGAKSVPDTIEVGIEEGAELGGWILLATALTGLLYLALSASSPPPGTAPPRSSP